MNYKLDNHNTPIDHSCDSELGTIQTQGRLYNSEYRWWNLSNLEREWDKKFDYMICYCANKDGKSIERLYIFHKSKIENRKNITVLKNPTDSHSNPIIPWYEQYRIKDKDIIRKVNDIWKEIIAERDNKLK